jgi:type IV pilus assembly protein PilP
MLLLFVCYLFPQNSNAVDDSGEYTFIRSKTYIKNPYELRDPFKKRLKAKKGMMRSKDRAKGIFDNSSESIETKNTDTIKIIGVMIGKDRRAMATTVGGKETFIIKEGMKIGENGAEVKAILPGGVVLAEKIRNVYDQEEYLETVLPVSDN